MPRKRLFPPQHPQTGQRLENKGRQDYSILTANDRIVLSRRRWSAPDLGSRTPLDALLDVAEASVSRGARELACRLNQGSRSFAKAAENLSRAAQITLSEELLRQVVEAEGKAVLAAEQAGTLTLTWTAADCAVPATAETPTAPVAPGTVAAPTRVYLGADGVKVPLVTDAEKHTRRTKVKQKRRRRGRKCRPLPKAKRGADQRYKEFKLVTFYDQTQAHRQVAVTRGDCEVAGTLMRRDAGRIRLDQASDKVALVDGADWIKNQIAKQSLPMDAVGLDFYHLADNVHKARRAVYGEEEAGAAEPPGQQWAAAVLHLAKHEGYAALRDRLVAWKKELRGTKRRQAAEQVLGYVTDRRAMIQYPEFVAQGRHIGSGPTESMCRATTERLKGVGMRWDADNAEAVMALEALDQSGAWKQYWDLCLRPAA
jgi:hypothetical protein